MEVGITHGEVVAGEEVDFSFTLTNTGKTPIVGRPTITITIDGIAQGPYTPKVSIPVRGSQDILTSLEIPQTTGTHTVCVSVEYLGMVYGPACSEFQLTVITKIYLPMVITPPTVHLSATPLTGCVADDLSQIEPWTVGWFGNESALTGALGQELGVISLVQTNSIEVCVHNPEQMPLGAHVVPVINGEQDWTKVVDLHPEHRGVLTFTPAVEAVVFVNRMSQ